MDVGKVPCGSSEHSASWAPAAAARAGDEREEAFGPADSGRQEGAHRGDAGLRCTMCTGTSSGGKRFNGPNCSRTGFCSCESNDCSAGSFMRQSKVNR